jgi:hypothetical protein
MVQQSVLTLWALTKQRTGFAPLPGADVGLFCCSLAVLLRMLLG